jgi:malate dehydrogenase (oxaloacetate-decarboxylating)
VLEVRARTINEEMKLAAAHAIAHAIHDDELLPDYIVPSVFDRRVAESVADAAATNGVARRERAHEPATPLETMH